MVAASIDYTVVDLTNLPQYSATADAIGLRPLEVLVQEWALLRAQVNPLPVVALATRIWHASSRRGLMLLTRLRLRSA